MSWRSVESKNIRKTGILFAGIFLIVGCLVLFPGMTGRVRSAIALSPELQTEAMMQFDRLEALHSGKLPMSRFAKADLVHQQEALFFTSDRDPADVVVRRTRALWNDLSKNPDAKVWEMEGELQSLERAVKNTLIDDKKSRQELYLQVCELRRKIAFANPLDRKSVV